MNDIVERGRRRRSEVETRPLSTWSSRYSIHALVRVDADRLVLRATNFVRGLSISFFVAAAVILLGWAQTNTLDESKARGGRAMTGGLFLVLACGTWLAPQRAVFDRRRGRLSRRYWFFRFSYPLEEIIAVQVIYGGRHKPANSSAYETRELNLVLNNSLARRVSLTNHTDHPTTRSMAIEIAKFLDVPVWDEFEREVSAAADQTANAGQPISLLAERLSWLARMCYLAAFVAAFFCVGLYLQQAKLDELEASLRPVRARLMATEVKEWIEGHDDWYAIGTFQIESGDYRGRAEGNLIPQSFYNSRHMSRHDSYSSIPRAEAEKFLPPWEIGKAYDGYIYPDAKEHILFELPGAKVNALNATRLGTTAGLLLALGLVASSCAAFIKRRQAEGRIDETASSIPSHSNKRMRKPDK